MQNQDDYLSQYLISSGRLNPQQLSNIRHSLIGQSPGSLGAYLVASQFLSQAELLEILKPISGQFQAAPPQSSPTWSGPKPLLQRDSSQFTMPVSPLNPRSSTYPASNNIPSDSAIILPSLNSNFGRYKIEEELDRGGMGVVYRVKCSANKPYALKLLYKADKDGRLARRFEREASVLSQLSHPSVVKVVEYGDSNGLPWLVMNYVEGGNLADYVFDFVKRNGEGLPLDEVLDLMESLAKALAYCHELGVIHRDLKPSNVVIRKRSGRPVLIDFGLVGGEKGGSEIEGLSNDLSQTGELLGTPAYMSPEQLDSSKVTTASDAWSFGAILYYALTGEQPFQGTTLAVIQAAVAGQEIPIPSSKRANLPKFFDELCLGMLERDIDKRLTMRDVERRLSSYQTTNYASNHRFARIIGSLILITLLIAGIYFGLNGTKPEPKIILSPNQKLLFATRTTRITGIVQNINSGIIRINDVQSQIKEGGEFELEFPSKEGRHTATLELASRTAGETIVALDFEYEVDSIPPSLRLAKYENTTALKKFIIKGRVSEPAIVKLGSLEVKTNDTGVFTISWALQPGVNKTELIVIDKAGHRIVEQIEIKKNQILTLSPGDSWPDLSDPNSGPREIHLSEGLYNPEIEIAGSVKIVGREPGVVVLARNNDAIILRGGSLEVENIEIRSSGNQRRKKLPGFEKLGHDPSAIRVYKGDLRVKKCRFFAPGHHAISVTGTQSSVRIEDCQFKLIEAALIAVDGSQLIVRRCQFDKVEAAGVFHGNRSAIIENCKIRETVNMGFLVFHQGNAALKNVLFDKCKSTAVTVSFGANVTATGLTVSDSGQSGIRVLEKGRILVKDSAISGSGRSGLEVNDAAVRVRNLTISNSKNHGLFIGKKTSFKGKLLKIRKSGKMGVGICAESEAVIEDLVVEDSGEYGVAVANTRTYGYLLNSRILRSKDDGFLMTGGSAAVLVKTHIEGSQKHGLKKLGGILTTHKLSFKNNKLGDKETKGAYVRSGKHIKPRLLKRFNGR